MTLRVHLTDDKLPKRLRKVAQGADLPGFAVGKPVGLWYACGTDWADYIKQEGGSLRGMWEELPRYAYVLDVDMSKMFVIDDAKKFEAFDKLVKERKNVRIGFPVPDWAAVAKVYSGVEICPYQWAFRMKSLWYYGWDVASGCIWNPRAIRSVEQMRTSEFLALAASQQEG